jgi:acylphosphatase
MKPNSQASREEPQQEKRAIRITYLGRVQGVGFRYTAKRLADERGIVGWVRNEIDGSVQLVAAGSPAQVEEFLDAIQDRMSGRIIRALREETVASDQWKQFEIRF